jgi:hypothetical protein
MVFQDTHTTKQTLARLNHNMSGHLHPCNESKILTNQDLYDQRVFITSYEI